MNRKQRRTMARQQWHNGIRGKRISFRQYWRRVHARPNRLIIADDDDII